MAKNIQFENEKGYKLSGKLTRPAGEPVAWALFAHCFTCTKNIMAAARITDALAERGIGVLRFDFTGLGESEGEFVDTTFSGNVDDLVAAAGYLEREYKAPALLVGHSLGGAAVLQAAARLPSVTAVATVAAPADPEHVTRNFTGALDRIRDEGSAEVKLAGRPFRIGRQFVEDLEQQHMEETIRDLGCALLVMHAPLDKIVDVDNAARIFQLAKHPKSFVSLDDADHLLSDEQDARYAARVIAAWAGRYLPRRARAAGPEAREGSVVVHAPGDSFTTQVVAGQHSLTADEPEKLGGNDSGLNPYELLLASLGACTAMTLGMYARQKNWPLKSSTVALRHARVHAKDCEDCDSSDGRIDEITREVTVEGDLDDKQRERLLEIADRCPVHRTLTGEIKIRTKPG